MITYHVEYTESGTRQIMRKGPYTTREEAASAPYGSAYGPIDGTIIVYATKPEPQD